MAFVRDFLWPVDSLWESYVVGLKIVLLLVDSLKTTMIFVKYDPLDEVLLNFKCMRSVVFWLNSGRRTERVRFHFKRFFLFVFDGKTVSC